MVLLVLELLYFKIADRFNIIDKPNERSSHSTIVLRGGGVIFAISILIWFLWQILVESLGLKVDSQFKVGEYIPFIVGLV